VQVGILVRAYDGWLGTNLMVMRFAATALIVVVAALHIYFLVLEMFLWRTPFGRRTFGTTPEAAESSAILAANQGLYNGFLAAGLLWALVWYGVVGGRALLTFFLICVIVAGVYGGVTVSRRILIVQALPAAIAAVLLWLS
jgi:putative membrane protein